MAKEIVPVLHGTLLDEESRLTLDEVCRICRQRSDFVITMVEEGMLDPDGETPDTWRFPGSSVTHVRIVVRLQRDLGINLEGAALVLDLLNRLAR
jgi:chaperone modulatory protein CbpM